MNFNIKLRPHHVTAFINYEINKKYLLSNKEYVKKFQEKNKGYHNEKFILYWKNFLDKLHNNENITFLYLNDYDDVCFNCDIKRECNNKKTKLYSLVRKLDEKSIENLILIEGKTYTIKYLKTIIS